MHPPSTHTLPKPKYNLFNPHNVTRMCVFRADHLCGWGKDHAVSTLHKKLKASGKCLKVREEDTSGFNHFQLVLIVYACGTKELVDW